MLARFISCLVSFFLQPEDYWFSAPKKGVMVFALPGEPGLAQLAGDFKVHFHDRQGDFYWFGSLLLANSLLSLLWSSAIRRSQLIPYFSLSPVG